ncbi:MAG TPA: carbohydrate ABC transporter permease [Spirochaetia bacterium]|nr:carbohydrate ABC transporter permease [Spirochaetia bacterium]
MTTDLRLRRAGPAQVVVLGVAQLLMGLYAVLIFYPLFTMIVSSFKTTREIFQHPFSLPTHFLLANYKTVWVDRGFGRYMANSLIVTLIAMAFVLLLGSMAAYGLSRYQYRLRTILYMLFLSGIMLPLKAAIIPLFMLIKGMGLMNTRASIILIFLAMGLPSTVFILSGFMRSIPLELEHAARIDGCNDWSIFQRVVLPVTTPAIALVTIYNAVPLWNDFFFPLVFLQSDRLKTLPVGLTTFFGQYSTNWSLLFTGLSIAIIPMLLLYVFMSGYFIRGLTAGAIK